MPKTKSLFHTAIIIATVSFTAACTPSATVMSRDSGKTGYGDIENATFGSSGEMSLQFPDETFRGKWVAVRNPGTQSFGLLTTYSSGPTATGNFAGFSQSDSGFGSAILNSDKGNSMRCEFRYSLITITAIGVCRKQDGEIFDLQVS